MIQMYFFKSFTDFTYIYNDKYIIDFENLVLYFIRNIYIPENRKNAKRRQRFIFKLPE